MRLSYLPAEKLAEALAQVPPGLTLLHHVNGTLLIHDSYFNVVGRIWLGTGELEMFDGTVRSLHASQVP